LRVAADPKVPKLREPQESRFRVGSERRPKTSGSPFTVGFVASRIARCTVARVVWVRAIAASRGMEYILGNGEGKIEENRRSGGKFFALNHCQIEDR
jgi:hypothetical protein